MYRKIHMTGGSGGVVYSRDLELFRRALAQADRGKPRWRPDFDDLDPAQYLFPALNWNTDELSCAVGLASLLRLKDTIVRRLAFVSALAALLAEIDTMFSLYPWTPADSPFAAPIFLDLSRGSRSKIDIAQAVRAEGIELNPHYAYLVADWAWAQPHHADRFDTRHARRSRDSSFCLYLNENYGLEEARDVAAALLKVHNALGKR